MDTHCVNYSTHTPHILQYNMLNASRHRSGTVMFIYRLHVTACLLVCNIAMCSEGKSTVLRAHESAVRCLSWSHDSSYLVSSAADGVVRVSVRGTLALRTPISVRCSCRSHRANIIANHQPDALCCAIALLCYVSAVLGCCLSTADHDLHRSHHRHSLFDIFTRLTPVGNWLQ